MLFTGISDAQAAFDFLLNRADLRAIIFLRDAYARTGSKERVDILTQIMAYKENT